MDCSPPGSPVHRIIQAGILEWIAIPFSGDLPDSETEPGSPPLQADSLQSVPPLHLGLIRFEWTFLSSKDQVSFFVIR